MATVTQIPADVTDTSTDILNFTFLPGHAGVRGADQMADPAAMKERQATDQTDI